MSTTKTYWIIEWIGTHPTDSSCHPSRFMNGNLTYIDSAWVSNTFPNQSWNQWRAQTMDFWRTANETKASVKDDLEEKDRNVNSRPMSTGTLKTLHSFPVLVFPSFRDAIPWREFSVGTLLRPLYDKFVSEVVSPVHLLHSEPNDAETPSSCLNQLVQGGKSSERLICCTSNHKQASQSPENVWILGIL